MRPRIRALIKAVVSSLGLVLFSFLIVEGIQLGNEYRTAGEVTATVQIPFYPFAYGFALALFPIAIMLFSDFIAALKEAVL